MALSKAAHADHHHSALDTRLSAQGLELALQTSFMCLQDECSANDEQESV